MLIILMFLPPLCDLRTVKKKHAINAGLSADPATSQLQLYNRAALVQHGQTARQKRFDFSLRP